MNKWMWCVSAVLAFSGLSQAANLSISGFQNPESVLYDAQQDVYLVSNINGDSFARDNNGFVAVVSPEGKILNDHWIAGNTNGVTLHAPKGMAFAGDVLYVADLDAVRLFDRKTGAHLRDVNIKSSFLNDVSTDAKGNVYVSDTGILPDFSPSGTAAIYQISARDQVKVLAQGPGLGLPNGLLVQPDGRLLVAPMGAASLYELKNGVPVPWVNLTAAGMDGLVQVGKDVLVSVWNTQSIFKVTSTGETSVVASNISSPADLGWDSKRNRLLVPVLMENRILFQDLD